MLRMVLNGWVSTYAAILWLGWKRHLFNAPTTSCLLYSVGKQLKSDRKTTEREKAEEKEA